MINITDNPSVSIIILNWNGKEDTLECLASVNKIDYPNYKIIVVDNGSSDGSVEAISKPYPDVTLLQTGENLGYAGGNNVGIRWALEHETDYILILNNDTVIAPNLLTTFVNAAKPLSRGSILGAKIYYYDKPDTIWFAGGRWLRNNNCFEHIGCNQEDNIAFDKTIEVDYITGCALFTESHTFKDVGLLDEEFFLTYEETDWCYRAKDKGHNCFVIPEAKLWHKVSSSFGGENSPLVHYFMVRNKLLWAERHLPLMARIKLHKENLVTLREIFLPPIFLSKKESSWAKSFLWSFSTWLKNKKKNEAMIKATLLGLRDYYLRNFGNCSEEVRKLGKSK